MRTKTDGVDSFVLARYGTLLKPAAWTPPPRKRRCCKRCWLGFGSAEQLAAYLRLVPVERQSGSSVLGRARLSKAGPSRIRAVLYMAAVVATRCNPHVKAVYERLLARGKSKMSALGAAMRKLVHLCFGVLKTRQPYQCDYAKIS